MHQNDKTPEDRTKFAQLSDRQYDVTQCGGTEPAFQNEYWDHKEEGIYVDVLTGIPLFSSTAKYDSGTGWPSFTEPIRKSAVTEHEDTTLRIHRTEVRAQESGSHLGHVFPDGPKEAGGMRYCMNSAALRFVPKDQMEREGYGEYLSLFA